MNIIKLQRERLAYTQSELAQVSGLSLRTIQRLEKSSVPPKGHSLKAIAAALDLTTDHLIENFSRKGASKTEDRYFLSMINLSALFFFIFPFGNIFVSLYIWRKHRQSELIDIEGRKIINIQILWSLLLCVALSLSPFITRRVPLIFVTLAVAIVLKLVFIVYTANQISKGSDDFIDPPIHFF